MVPVPGSAAPPVAPFVLGPASLADPSAEPITSRAGAGAAFGFGFGFGFFFAGLGAASVSDGVAATVAAAGAFFGFFGGAAWSVPTLELKAQ